MSAALALLPLVLVVTLMIGLRWSAATAGVCGAVAAALVAVLHFGYEGAASVGLALSLLGMLAEATSVALTIVWIVFPALCLHELQLRTGATDTIRRGLAQLSSDRRLIALLVAWFFALLVEGAAGFGTPVALAAPLLVGLGFAPLKAVTLSLIGHSVGVSFGAVGTPVMPQAAASGISPLELAGATALLHAALGWTMAMLVYRLAGDEGDSTHWVWPTLASACFLIPYLAIATWVGPELPTLGGALIGGLVFALIARRRGLGAEPVSRRELLAAALPYVLLLALILATRLVPPVRAALTALELRWSLFGAFTGGIQPLYHPGTILMLCFVFTGVMRGRPWRDLQASASLAVARLPLVLVALIAMLALARIMLQAGLIEALSDALAGTLGAAWPLLAPAVGVLGTFVTGSATASNILLSDLQLATAAAAGLPALLMMAAQGFGAAVGNIICPHNLVAGNATVGLLGREGEVMRRTLPACCLYAALGGLLVLAIARLTVSIANS